MLLKGLMKVKGNTTCYRNHYIVVKYNNIYIIHYVLDDKMTPKEWQAFVDSLTNGYREEVLRQWEIEQSRVSQYAQERGMLYPAAEEQLRAGGKVFSTGTRVIRTGFNQLADEARVEQYSRSPPYLMEGLPRILMHQFRGEKAVFVQFSDIEVDFNRLHAWMRDLRSPGITCARLQFANAYPDFNLVGASSQGSEVVFRIGYNR